MKSLIYYAICYFVLTAILFLRKERYKIDAKKVILISFYVGIVGLLGTKIMYFIENGVWDGKSFFGAVLFFPILLLPGTKLFNLKIGELLDLATPAGMAMLAIFKWNCYCAGCCGGKAIWYSQEGIPAHFPSQIAEMIAAIFITIILICCERKMKWKNTLYPICLVLYGTTRLVLNRFRSSQAIFLMGITAGSFWSIISLIIGTLCLVLTVKKQ